MPKHALALLSFSILLSSAPAGADDLRERAAALFGAVEAPSAQEIAAPPAVLGRALFWDVRVSADGATACASCHGAADWGADRRVRSPDARGKPTKRHSQTVFNTQAAAAGLRWVADRPSGAAQALGSITGSMGFDRAEDLIPVLEGLGYRESFRAAFPGDDEPLRPERYAQALEAYQRTLRTPAAFDRWLAGEDTALDAEQRRGLARFIELGCAGCHDGPLFGGRILQRFGIVKDYWLRTGSTEQDLGLMQTSGREADRNRFRVQPLRNVARTAPYFHDGAVADLGEAVAVMAELQLGVTLEAADRVLLLRFLDGLTGEVPAHYAGPCAEGCAETGTANHPDASSQQSGMFVYLADAASIELCADGRRVPVAMEGDFLALQSAYMQARREPGQALLVTVEGRIAERPSAEPGQPPRETLVVERFVSIRDARACGDAEAATP